MVSIQQQGAQWDARPKRTPEISNSRPIRELRSTSERLVAAQAASRFARNPELRAKPFKNFRREKCDLSL